MRWTGMTELKQVWADGVGLVDRDDSRGVTDGVDGDDRAD
jgi:hypothetical protein